MKTLFLIILFSFVVAFGQQNLVNGWEVLPLVDIYGNWFFDREKTFSQLGTGFQTFNVAGNTHPDGQYNYIKADNLKDFSNIIPTNKRILEKYMGFRYRISKLVGNVSEIMIIVGVQDSIRYISNNTMGEYIKNPVVGDWKEIRFETKEVTNRIASFNKLRFETWVSSLEAGYIGISFDIDELFGEDSLGIKTVYDSFDISDVPLPRNSVPEEFKLEQNYPNPFNPTTQINYSIQKAGMVSLKIYDILGRVVADLVNKHQESGSYTVDFNASKLSTGVYFYKLESGSFIQTRKMILIK